MTDPLAPTTEQEIIAEAKRNDGSPDEINTLLDALESFYGNGSADEVTGDVDTIGHFYRVDRWIVHTDSQGFHNIITSDTISEAAEVFRKIDQE